ncbi:MAG: hypothetical protein IH840_05205 [Candidatus Heimdallarchaeota archaeon]|nr:hypothetical protein [Candidatus Heimdallarchaeota archaeon]
MDTARMIHNILKELLESSTEIAFKDGQITTDEAALLELLGEKLITIESELLPMIDNINGDLSEEDLVNRIKLVARDILPALTKLAEEDGIILPDESAILSRLLNDIMN